MDPLTHALASYTLKRSAFPRLARPATVAMVLAGTVADLDMLSRYLGPSAYLTWHRTYAHSLFAAVLISFVAPIAFFLLRRAPEKRNAPLSVFLAAIAASVFHLLLDLCQSQGIELLWPFSSRRFAADWLAALDLWIFAFLVAGLGLPKLSSLITEEIGAKYKGPRGRVAAFLVLATILLYIAARGALHSNATATLDARTYRGESPRRVAAFPESVGLFSWHGIVETDRALHEVAVSVVPGSSFDPDSARTSYKPEPSPALDAALRTATARRFLAYARFPKASIEKKPDGYRIHIRSFPYNAGSTSGARVTAIIDTDPSGKILDESLAWDRPSH
jgi:membrane-bound metal-dependent hydrolase YbcI (DUF457 family)